MNLGDLGRNLSVQILRNATNSLDAYGHRFVPKPSRVRVSKAANKFRHLCVQNVLNFHDGLRLAGKVEPCEDVVGGGFSSRHTTISCRCSFECRVG